MKTFRKILAVVLAAVMALALAAPAFADDNDGSITIRNANVGETYTAYKIFDLTYQVVPAVGTEGEDGYVPAKTLVSYTYTATGEGDANVEAMNATGSPFKLTDLGEGKYTVSLADDAPTGAGIAAWLETNWDWDNATPAAEPVTATSSEVEFENLAYGYYYIETALGATVTIDSTLKDVTVIDKNNVPGWDNEPGDDDDVGEDPNPGKVIVNADGTKTTVNSVNYGDTVNFSIALNAYSYVVNEDKEAELVTYYYITDTLADGFGAAENIVVTVYEVGNDGKYVTEGECVHILTSGEYTLEQDDNTFQITVPFGEKFGSKAKIEVTYSATVNADGEDVVIAGEGNLNIANYGYSTVPSDPDDPDEPTIPDDDDYPDPEDPTDPDDPSYPYKEENEKKTTTYVYAIAIEKVDDDKDPLAGATFSVKDADGNAIAAVVTAVAGEYKFSASGVTTFATDANGYLVIKGLEEGTYTVTEVDAPDGYNKLTETVDIDAACTGSSTFTTTTYYYDKDGKLTNVEEVVEEDAAPTYKKNAENFGNVPAYMITIENHSGTELPSTGGIGTTLFIVFGAIAMIGAGIFLVTNKRIAKESF